MNHNAKAPDRIVRPGKSRPELLWLMMSLKDLKAWLIYFEKRENFENCIEIRDEIKRRG